MRNQWRPVAVAGALLLLITWLFLQSRSTDPTLRSRLHDALQRVELHDTELTRDVLLARAGLLPNYDPITQTNRKLSTAVSELRAYSASLSGDPGKRIDEQARTLTEALQQKVRSVEYFKSDNALLHNSLAYLIHASEAVRRRPGIPPALTAQVAALSQALLRFLQANDPASVADIEKSIAGIEQSAPARPDLQDLTKHARLILQLLPQVDQSARHILQARTLANADRLQDLALLHADRLEARAQIFRVLLYLLALSLLAYLLVQFQRLRVAAVRLGQTNVQLRHEMDERKSTLEALRDSEERYRAMAESANDAIVSADRQGTIVSWNPQAERLFGYRSEEVLGTNLTRLMPPRYREAHTKGFEHWAVSGCSDKMGQTMELVGARKDGAEFPIELSLSSWTTSHGDYITGTIRDLTERKRLQETARKQELQLIQANKMTALGTLVSGVAHEINNPNQLVLTNCALVAQAWGDAAEILDANQSEHPGFTIAGLPYSEMRETVPLLIRDAQDGALRIKRIIADLKGYARPAQPAVQPFDLNEAAQRALRLLGHLVHKHTDRFCVDLGDNLPALHGDVQHAEQIIVNLVVNALEALPDRSRAVTVRTSRDSDGDGVLLEVIDEGHGIAPEHRSRLCDPFFTTKQATGGTGLGLAITWSLIHMFAGTLSFASQPGHGTQVTVRFPGAPASASTDSDSA